MKHALILFCILLPFPIFSMEDGDDSEYVLIRPNSQRSLVTENQPTQEQLQKKSETDQSEMVNLKQQYAQELQSYQREIEQLRTQNKQDQQTILEQVVLRKKRAKNKLHNTVKHVIQLNRVYNRYKRHNLASQALSLQNNEKMKQEYDAAFAKLQAAIKLNDDRLKLEQGSIALIEDWKAKCKTLGAQYEESYDQAREQVYIIQRLHDTNDVLLGKNRILMMENNKLKRMNFSLVAQNNKLLESKKTQ